jgi:MtN3 and saliva related transmembrane protein
MASRRHISSSMASSVPTFLGTTAAILTTASFSPQLLHLWRARSAHAISASMYTIFAIGLLLWIVYGIVIGAWPIVIANSITALQAIAILWMKVRFSRGFAVRGDAHRWRR